MSGLHELELIERQPASPSDKSPVLFVHGAAHGAWCWQHWMEVAAEAGHPAYAVSLRGHAGSGGSLIGASLGSYVEDVIRIADSLPGRPVLVGHSLGGLVVQRTIAEYEAAAAVCVAPVSSRPGWRTLVKIGRQHPLDLMKILAGGSLPMRHEYLFEGLDLHESDAWLERCGKESAVAQFQVLLHRPSSAPKGGAPVLFLGTPEDNLIALADVRDAAQRYSAPLIEFPGMGHDLMLDEGWKKPAEAMLEWLDQVS